MQTVTRIPTNLTLAQARAAFDAVPDAGAFVVVPYPLGLAMRSDFYGLDLARAQLVVDPQTGTVSWTIQRADGAPGWMTTLLAAQVPTE